MIDLSREEDQPTVDLTMSDLDSISTEDLIPMPEEPIDKSTYVRDWVKNIDSTADPDYSSDEDDIDDSYSMNVSFIYINN